MDSVLESLIFVVMTLRLPEAGNHSGAKTLSPNACSVDFAASMSENSFLFAIVKFAVEIVANHNRSFQIIDLRDCVVVEEISCVYPELQISRFFGPKIEEKKKFGLSAPPKCLTLKLISRRRYAISKIFKDRFPN